MIQIRSSASIDFSDGIKCCLYGRSGSGKTPILATAPIPLIISLEKGLLSLRALNPPVPFIDCNNNPSRLAPIDYLEMEVLPWLWGSQESQQFYTIGVDSIAEVMDLDLEARLLKEKDPRKAFYNSLQRVKIIARKFRDLPRRTVVLAFKEEQDVDPDTGYGKIYQPMVPGKVLSAEMPYFFDEVWRAERGVASNNQEWTALRCHKGALAHARDRSGMLAEYEPTNLTKVFTKILTGR